MAELGQTADVARQGAGAGDRDDPLRVAEGDPLRQQSAHRMAEDVRPAPAEGVQDGDGVVRHVLGGVGGPALAEQPADRAAAVSAAAVRGGRHPVGLAGVPLVVGHHVEAEVEQSRDQLPRPPEPGRAEAHHQQQRLPAGTAEVLVGDPDAAVLGEACLGHGRLPSALKHLRTLYANPMRTSTLFANNARGSAARHAP
jgi:hypothetical protein